MIIVTGTKRSGTSMWMHVLVAAGLPAIGERFPAALGDVLTAANPDGFFESELVAGINFQTNPHPVSGAYLAPQATRQHAVKVFIPGLVRTDVAFIDHCIATVRDWRSFVASSRRLRALAGVEPGTAPATGDSLLPPALEWWSCNYGLVRDLAIRGYPVHVLSYDGFLRDPERTTNEVLGWIGAGDPVAAARVVSAKLRTQQPEASVADRDLAEGIDATHLQVFDELFDAIDRERPLAPAFVQRLNLTDRALAELVLEHHARMNAQTVDRLLPHGDPRWT